MTAVEKEHPAALVVVVRAAAMLLLCSIDEEARHRFWNRVVTGWLLEARLGSGVVKRLNRRAMVR